MSPFKGVLKRVKKHEKVNDIETLECTTAALYKCANSPVSIYVVDHSYRSFRMQRILVLVRKIVAEREEHVLALMMNFRSNQLHLLRLTEHLKGGINRVVGPCMLPKPDKRKHDCTLEWSGEDLEEKKHV